MQIVNETPHNEHVTFIAESEHDALLLEKLVSMHGMFLPQKVKVGVYDSGPHHLECDLACGPCIGEQLLQEKLEYAIKIIESYQLDIRDRGLDKEGFCQGVIYKEALGKLKYE